ncbi:hypothetical protein CAC02_02635 [Streptococcus gallolyticus]|uniref:Uncharacterized protein n=1 Tax=Streptococcus gallolyticus TaxID=315405 RepID=A0A368UGW9_9STRE|nr:hypothetical protein [Streptococcus gallolyticus]RCW17456.1 hypothetical protein CAC02_02635 [Streptococcus gallolyticus]
MLQFMLIFSTVVLEFLALKNFLSINLKEYQGFTTRFFSSSNDTISTNSVIFWIFISPVFSCFTYLVIWFLNDNFGTLTIGFNKLWLISLFFWLGEYLLIILLGRRKLVNEIFIFSIAVSSLLLNYYLSVIAFTGDIKDILPNASNTTFQLYLIFGAFVVSAIQVGYQNDNYTLKRNRFILRKFDSYLSKFDILLKLDNPLLYLVTSILLVEDFERPKVIRFFEKIVNSSTRNIAQNDSLNDYHSVFLLTQNIQELYNNHSELGNWIYEIAYEYNHSEQYAHDVVGIYYILQNLDARYSISKVHRSTP